MCCSHGAILKVKDTSNNYSDFRQKGYPLFLSETNRIYGHPT